MGDLKGSKIGMGWARLEKEIGNEDCLEGNLWGLVAVGGEKMVCTMI